MKKIFIGKVLCNDEIAKDIFKVQIEIDCPVQIKPGQFVNIYLEDKSLLLPRPVSICDEELQGEKNTLVTLVYRVVGKGTAILSKYRQGDNIQISSPLGNGYFTEGRELGGMIEDYRGKRVIVVGGGIGVPPMVLLSKKLKEKGAEVIAAVGFQEEPFLINELDKHCSTVHVATDNGAYGYRGNAVQMIKEKALTADEFFSCGPKIMLEVLSEYAVEKGIPCQVSLEERMGCGYGACVGCTCKIKVKTENGIEIQQKGVCKHGPVFFGEEVLWK